MRWQPIESAPKDREVLLLDPEVGVCMGAYYSGKYWTTVCVRGGEDDFSEPTHWMPLPEPPK